MAMQEHVAIFGHLWSGKNQLTGGSETEALLESVRFQRVMWRLYLQSILLWGLANGERTKVLA